MSVEELFQVANVAEMYDVAELMDKVKKVVAKLPINFTNVVALAHTAEQFSFFQEVSQILLDSCTAFLCRALEHRVLDFSGLVLSPQHSATASRLLSLSMEQPPALPEPICTGESCHHYSCKVRQAVAQREERRRKHVLDFYAAVQPPQSRQEPGNDQ